MRLDIRRTGAVKRGEDVIGSETKVKVVKNKVAPPFKSAEFEIVYGQGVNHAAEVLDMAVNARLVEKSGAWYQCRGETIGQGKENAAAFLRENPTLLAELEAEVRALRVLPVPCAHALPPQG